MSEKQSLAARRADVARAERQKHLNPGDPERVEHASQLRRDYAAEKLADYVAKVVAQAPPLTPAQRDKIAVLLRDGAPPGMVATTDRPDLGGNQEGGREDVLRGGVG